jgi:uncharacterized protein (DUF1786 family)
MLFVDYSTKASNQTKMNTKCVFCSVQCTGYSCLQCNQMNRAQKFARLLQILEQCSESIVYYDEIVSAVQRIRRVSLLE